MRKVRIRKMKNKKKRASFVALALALAMCMSLAACGSKNSTATSPAASGEAGKTDSGITKIAATDASKLPSAASQRKDTLVIGTAELSGKFQQLYAESVDDWHVSWAISGAPLQNNDDEGNLVDGTAKMTVSDDGLTYTFKLKYDDKYSDGSPVKAEDYVNFYKVLADSSYDGPINPITSYNVTGAQAYHDGTAKDISGIKVVDDKTIEIKLDKANSSAQYALGGAYPISTALYGDTIKQGDLSAFKAIDMKTWVGNGTYTLTDYQEGQNATLKANPNYCEGAAKIPTIIVKIVAQGAEMQAITTGEVDLEEEVTCNADNIALGQNAKFINMQVQPTLGYGWVGLNHKNPLFTDQKVRQALLYAIDRKGLVKNIYGDYGHVQNINQTAQSWLYTEEGINSYDYDLDKAASLLKEAGWEKDSSGKLMKDGKEFKFAFSASQSNAVTKVLIPMMIDAYKQLGITVEADYVDWPTLQNKFNTQNYDMAFMAWGLTPDPDDSYIYSTGGSQNWLNYSNPEVDKAYQEALAATDKETRKADYHKVYQLLNTDLPNFIIYQRSDCIAYNTRLKTFQCSPYVPSYQQYNLYELQ